MDEKPTAGLVALAVAGPLMLLCCLAPVMLPFLIAGTAAWYADLSPIAIFIAFAVVGASAMVLLKRRRRRILSEQISDDRR